MRSDLCARMQPFVFALMQAIPMLIRVFLTDGISVEMNVGMVNTNFRTPGSPRREFSGHASEGSSKLG